jgi:hypothetical protein
MSGCYLPKVRMRLMATIMAAAITAGAANASTAVADVNNAALNAVRASAATTPPPKASRALAMVTVSVFDAVNATTKFRYEAYQAGLTAGTGLNRDAVAYAAGYTQMANLFPALAASLNAERDAKIAALGLSVAARNNALAFGASVANGLFAARANDGAATAQTPYTPGGQPGDFVAVGAPGAPPVLPSWGQVTPFAIPDITSIRLGPPPALGSAEFIADYNQVRLLGCATCGTTEQQTIASFWADGGGTLTPPGHWLDIATSLDAFSGLTTLDAARLSAMVGVSVADAGISAWDIKYAHDYWRPVTAINVCTLATCGVAGEPGWDPYLKTPNFPSYVSGHSSFSGAGAAAIGGFFGSDSLNFCVSADPLSGVMGQRCFTSLRSAADEAGLSRIFGGIHYEFDNGRAIDSAFGIGQFVSNNLFQLSAVPEPDNWAMMIVGFGLVGVAARRRTVVTAVGA